MLRGARSGGKAAKFHSKSAFCSVVTIYGRKEARQHACLLVREAAPCCVYLYKKKLLLGFCISHKEFTKIGLIQIWQSVNFTLRSASTLALSFGV
jgi:hypothetical protein